MASLTGMRSDAPDLHMKDIEILLRGFAMLMDGAHYAPSMVSFLNRFSQECRKNSAEKNDYLERLFRSFLRACARLPDDVFLNKQNNRFNIALYEAVFAGSGKRAIAESRLIEGMLDAGRIRDLETDKEFSSAALEGRTNTANVEKRLSRAEVIVGTL